MLNRQRRLTLRKMIHAAADRSQQLEDSCEESRPAAPASAAVMAISVKTRHGGGFSATNVSSSFRPD
jgi:hypothetical protein